MITPVQTGKIYNTSAKIEENTIMNRAILDIGGFAVPNSLMANNRVEGVERFIKSGLYFLMAMVAPLIFLRSFNKAIMKKAGLVDSMKDNGVQLIQLSNEFLVKDHKHMENGINQLAEKLSEKEKFKNIKQDFDKILDKFSDKEALREKLIKLKRVQMTGDLLFAGLATGSIPWYINELTKKVTGRSGNTGEFEMASKEYVENNAKKHEKTKYKKAAAAFSLTIATALLIPTIMYKGMTTKNPKGIMKWVQNNAKKFDYTDGIYIKRLPYLLLEVFGGNPQWILSCRDKYEMRDWAIRLPFLDAVFFGGDLALNNIFARVLDKFCGTKLIDKAKQQKNKGFLSKLFVPLKSLDELKNPAISDAKTRKFALGMYWGNFAITMGFLGFGFPVVMNKILKTSVQKDLNSHKTKSSPIKTMQEFVKNGKISS